MCHVLIIEDEPLVALIIQDLLEEEGATSFEIAATQSAAVAAARTHKPDFITSDVRLLQGTGPAAVAQIFDELGEVPVVFISATPDECRPCAPPGIILAKPFENRALAHAFHSMV
ncbi:response regulator [Novosphingobium terrae]|uniref:response regulator n=1 Tax=Novosphingobium terrae TaxID=2726189 RepID=UPI0019809872|nr:response regulator [Novosphingobium terrae]